ncbi:hypothetical protein RND71_018252 [Anisodus tanguticus]|uniref:Zinc knuckle CX2CX4HX4C domain-containing protein n=1 Tax=Anisodus tanguticus TaxID=243964 RepID=A0AAE1VGS4_9SOLA|nr:hypothetical protein RND71_018252 [Anisodus tanguticus]
MELWVQIHDIVSGLRSERVARDIRNFLREFVRDDSKNYDLIWRDYMHVRVRIDVRLPLKCRMQVTIPGGDWITLTFKYERLGTFCFFCGLVGHSDKYCRGLYRISGITREQYLFGSWLRADTRASRHMAGARWIQPAADNQEREIPNRANPIFSHGMTTPKSPPGN